jgi:hypothetical protein
MLRRTEVDLGFAGSKIRELVERDGPAASTAPEATGLSR